MAKPDCTTPWLKWDKTGKVFLTDKRSKVQFEACMSGIAKYWEKPLVKEKIRFTLSRQRVHRTQIPLYLVKVTPEQRCKVCMCNCSEYGITDRGSDKPVWACSLTALPDVTADWLDSHSVAEWLEPTSKGYLRGKVYVGMEVQ